MASSQTKKSSTKSALSAQPIGVFDSGLGGLTVVRQLRRVMPHEDIVYLGDTARVPYGTKSPDTVSRFASEAVQFLVGKGVKAVVLACNTATAWGLEAVERRFDLPIFGVIQPGVEAALRRSRGRRIGVIATPATIRSDAYRRLIFAHDRDAMVVSRSCPLLVPLVEEGWHNHPVTDLVLREYLHPLLKDRIDTLVLGCTHYPLLKRALRRVAGHEVVLVDSAGTCAEHVRDRLERLNLRARSRRREGSLEAYVTDEVSRFVDVASRFLRMEPDQVSRIDLAPLA